MFIEYLVFITVVLGCLYVDLSQHKETASMTTSRAARDTFVWVLVSIGFGGFIYFSRGVDDAQLYFAGYFLEKALSVDNLLVFISIFSSFGLMSQQDSMKRYNILYYGILGVIVLRSLFVFAGTELIALSGYVLVLFGFIIIGTALYMHYGDDGDDEVDYTKHWSVRFFSNFMNVTPLTDDNNLFIKSDSGILHATPLFLCLIVIEISDVIFAFDSVPTVLAVTRDPFLALSASVFAVLGLRSMFFLLDSVRKTFDLLEPAIVLLLLFVGTNIIMEGLGVYHVPVLLNLSVILILIFGACGLSFYRNRGESSV